MLAIETRKGFSMERFFMVVGVICMVLVFVVGIALVMAFPTMWIINYLCAPSFLEMVFGVSSLTFWKAFWLNVIAGILFKSSPSSSSSKN